MEIWGEIESYVWVTTRELKILNCRKTILKCHLPLMDKKQSFGKRYINKLVLKWKFCDIQENTTSNFTQHVESHIA